MASSAAGDTSIPITFTYLDASGLEQTATVNTNASDGRTPVSLGVTATELFRAHNSGSTDLAGNVAFTTANDFTGGVPNNQDEVLAYIPASDQQTQVLARRIPADKQAILTNLRLYLSRASGAAGSADVVFQIRLNGEVWRTTRPYQITTSVPVDEMIQGTVLPPLTDIRLRIRDVSDASSAIAGSVDFLLVDV